MHRRHKPYCVSPRVSAGVADGGTAGGEGGGTTIVPISSSSDDTGVENATTPAYESEEDEPPPTPLNPMGIRSWTVQSVIASVLHSGKFPTKVEEMKYIPHQDGCPFVQCLLCNEHGAVSLKLPSTLVCLVPALRAQYEGCVARWHHAEHQHLVDLFERACAHASSKAVRAALERLLAE